MNARELGISWFNYLCDAGKLEAFLHKYVNEAEADLRVESNVSDRSRRRNVCDKNGLGTVGGEYFFGGNVRHALFVHSCQPAQNT